MDVSRFQEMLNGICRYADQNKKKLTAGQVQAYFAETELTGEQLAKVLQYLKRKGIEIEGAPELPAEETEEQQEDRTPKRVPLTAEEEAYVREYMAELAEQPKALRESSVLFEALLKGDEMARAELTGRYLKRAAELAVERNCPEIHIADLIQEANISLLTAIGEPETEQPDEEWLLGRISRGIEEAIHMQTEQKFADDCLVAKVEKLEAAVRELSDEEEEGSTKFSIEELAIILDMDAEEIRNVLRLTGDDK